MDSFVDYKRYINHTANAASGSTHTLTCSAGTKKVDKPDARKDGCVLYDGDKVETLAHYNWRMSMPFDKISNSLENEYTAEYCIYGGFGIGGLFAVVGASWLGFDLLGGNKIDHWATFLLVLGIIMIIVLSLILVYIVQPAIESDTVGLAAENAKQQSDWKSSEPSPVFE
jgi:hypothetical protein